jgi:peptidoglycan/LPS O-acetylase OafA/YrhL
VLFVILMLVSVAVARISYLIYERPMIRIVRRLFSVKPRAERTDQDIVVDAPRASALEVRVPPAA